MSKMPSYMTECKTCGRPTGKVWARDHEGECKECNGRQKCGSCGGVVEMIGWGAMKRFVCKSCMKKANEVCI